MVDDPYVYGQIAAANALSDVYAMGAEPRTALNLVGFPDDQIEGFDWLGSILEGGAERCTAAGVSILGGHTVRDAEIKFGYAVTGVVHPQKILTNATARPGDRLVLTKALGTGFVTTANKRGDCPKEVLDAACASMVQLNAAARDAALRVGVSALTDVTGFGLVGHTLEMAEGSGVTICIDVGRLPLLPGSEALVRYKTRASKTNAEYVAPHSRFEGPVDPVRSEFLFDAQTSGGLLISVPADRAEALVADLRQHGCGAACVIGEVVERREPGLALVFRA